MRPNLSWYERWSDDNYFGRLCGWALWCMVWPAIFWLSWLKTMKDVKEGKA